LVFDRGDGHWLGQSSWRKAQQQFCTLAGVPFIRCHDLRHTAAALLMELNIHPKVAAEILGHADVSMTLDRYSQVSPALQRRSTSALSALLFEDPEM
ncbi:MAG: tyrosine-type recombinase/integrase, partial [Chloroflexota bacterium]|nr:tyrosine-type recombinase/integrase [Chloroflexota bacterium]